MGDSSVIKETYSVCPVCLKRIPARLTRDHENVYMEKDCPEHGPFSSIVWRGSPSYEQWGRGRESPGPEQGVIDASVMGCPYDCGLCTSHKARTCTVLMEVTERCNLKCPVCFAQSGGPCAPDPGLDEVRSMLESVRGSGGLAPVQLSGGEPTVRDDLDHIVFIAKELGFPHVQLNTNGIRLANEPVYALELKQAGLDLVYLQFDGVTDDVYQKVRGADLVKVKEAAIKNCARVKLAVQLVPTIIPGVNTDQIGEIVQYAKKWIPVVKGVHFQPVSYFGRFPTEPLDEERITIPEVLRALESQTNGEIKADNFVPRRRSDSHCGFSGFFVLDSEGALFPTTFFDSPRDADTECCGQSDPAEHVRQFITERSVYKEEPPCPCCAGHEEPDNRTDRERLEHRAYTHYLSISGMPFQDAWTLDLDRLRGCCVHVISPKTRQLVPFCAYYLTSESGVGLYESMNQNLRKARGQECAGIDKRSQKIPT